MNIMTMYQDGEYEIRVKKDQYGRDTDVHMISYFPSCDCVQKIKFVYDKKGDLLAFRYDFISNQNKISQMRRYLFDENHLPTAIDVCHMEDGRAVYKETITFHTIYAPDVSLYRIMKQQNGKNSSLLLFTDIQQMQFCSQEALGHDKWLYVVKKQQNTYELYLPTGVQSCSIVNTQTQKGVPIWKIKNPVYGKYAWRLVGHTLDTYDLDGVSDTEAYFEVAIYEYVFTVDVFCEICRYAKERVNGNIKIGISGLLFATPQQEAIKIAKIAKTQNITYQFLS